MTEFSTYRAFQNFRRHVLRESRYVHNEDARLFLETVLATSEKRHSGVPEGRIFYRAQKGHDWRTLEQDGDAFDVPAPYSQKRMRPLAFEAKEGRANPKGIPCLYLATEEKTAMSEMRPSVGDYVSVGQFKTLKPLTLIDCSIGHDSGINLYFDLDNGPFEPDAKEREKAVWNDIDRAFSEPVTDSDKSADYAPTQIISELFRSKGFDGIAYKSHLGDGFNVALFDLDAADIINCGLFEVKAVAYEFKETGDRYFVRKYNEQKAEAGK